MSGFKTGFSDSLRPHLSEEGSERYELAVTKSVGYLPPDEFGSKKKFIESLKGLSSPQPVDVQYVQWCLAALNLTPEILPRIGNSHRYEIDRAAIKEWLNKSREERRLVTR